MQVSLETGEGLERKLTIQVPAETVDKEVENRLQSMKSRVKIDGFRPGKVPLKVVKQQYGVQVHQEVISEMIQNTFRDAVLQEDLKLAGSPNIVPKNMAMGESLEYVATFEIYPVVELADYTALEIDKITAEVVDSDVDTMIETLQKQRAEYNIVERAAQKDDQVIIDFDGYIDGESFEGGKASSAPLIIGSNSMIPGFEGQIIGKSATDEFTIDVTFPDNYNTEKLRGKKANFETKLISVAEVKLPEVDEEFAKNFGVTDGGIDKLRTDIRENMQRELKNKLQTELKNNVMDAILKVNEIEIPKSLIDDECGNLQKQMSEAGQLQGDMSLPKDLFASEAKRRVSLGLIVNEIIKVAEIKVDSDRVNNKIEEVASTYEDPQEVISHYANNPQLKSGIESLVMEEMVVDWVIDQATMKDVSSSFGDLMKSPVSL